MKRALIVTVFFLILLFVGSLVFTPIAGNIWSQLTGRGFIIPSEANVFTFRVTKWNDGSGEWWLYGEDGRFFYHFSGDKNVPYLIFPKNRVGSCRDFNSTNVATWSPDFVEKARERQKGSGL